jgi:two-component system sensor histidine kinase KdpD
MRWKAVAGTVVIVALCTLVAEVMHRHFDLLNLTMVFLVGVVATAVAFGRGPAMLAAFLSVAVFDFVFVPPRFTFRVTDTQYLFTFAVMLLVAAVIGTLTAMLRERLEDASRREHRVAALHRLSRDLAVRTTAHDIMSAAVTHVGEILGARVAVMLPDAAGQLTAAAGQPAIEDLVEAKRAFETGQVTGPALDGGAGSLALHVPLEASMRVLGVLSVRPDHAESLADRERVELLRALASQTAMALERCRLAADAESARAHAETERMRSSLLSSVSHDLRTPLAAITGAASSLRDATPAMPQSVRRELAETIADQATRLNQLIGNLLDMTRLESGALRVCKEWHVLEDVVGAALVRLAATLGDRPVQLHLPKDLPLVPIDEILFEQVVRNLVENADHYSPPGASIEVAAVAVDDALCFEVADRGPGLAPGGE